MLAALAQLGRIFAARFVPSPPAVQKGQIATKRIFVQTDLGDGRQSRIQRIRFHYAQARPTRRVP
jgi:hypothetical protein